MSKTMSTTTKMTTTSNGKKMYNREYKLEVLQLLSQSGKSRSELERELGLYSGQINAWEKFLQRDKEQAFPGTGHQTEVDVELRRLRREVEILRQERDILKKQLAYGSSQSSRKHQAQSEVCLHTWASSSVRGEDHVSSAGCFERRLLHLAQTKRPTTL